MFLIVLITSKPMLRTILQAAHIPSLFFSIEVKASIIFFSDDYDK